MAVAPRAIGHDAGETERAVAPTIPRAPAKVAPTRASSSSTTILNKHFSQFSTTLSATPTQPSSKLSYNQVRIAELYESFILRQEVESARQILCGRCGGRGGALSASSLAEASKVPGTFMDVLKVTTRASRKPPSR